jgi:hypothetical protein
MSMGGFTGSVPTPTLTSFEKLAVKGRIQYVLVNRGFGNFGGFGAFGFAGGRTGRSGSAPSLSATAAVDLWTIQHGVHVPADAYGDPGTGGSLYYVGPPSSSPLQR